MTFVVLAGQSNALGFGNTGPAPMCPTPLVQIWNGSAFETMVPGVNTGTPANPGAWGPEVAFAVHFGLQNPGETLYILKSVKGSTGIANDPAQLDWSPHSHELFDFTAREIAETGMAPDAILWSQGEQDAFSAAKAAAYQDNLADLFWNMRFAWGNSDVEIIYNDLPADLPFAAQVRAGQAAVDGGFGQYHMVDGQSLTLQADGLHLDFDGQIQLGARFYFDGWAVS